MFPLVVLLTVAAPTTQSTSPMEIAKQLIGSRLCRVDFGMALDRNRDLELVSHKVSGARVLAILKRKSTEDCAEVIDAVAGTWGKSFEFSCVDANNKSAVVVGEIESFPRGGEAKTADSWLIDTTTLKIGRYARSIVCTNEGYAGADDGSDLVSDAKARGSTSPK